MNYRQQGDCLLKEDTIPKEAKTIKTDLLWKGQNHHHRVKGKYKLLKKENVIYVDSKGATLFHEEHKDIKLPKGQYALSIVVEYDHWLEESRAVID